MTLPADVTRCMGIDFVRQYICPERHLCQSHVRLHQIEHCGTYPVWLMREPDSEECEYMMSAETKS